jgi:hypothetical protein
MRCCGHEGVAINDILQKHGFSPLSEKELAPIVAA